jgi:hypothetical protein
MGGRNGRGFTVRWTNKRYEEWNAGEGKEGDNCNELSVKIETYCCIVDRHLLLFKSYMSEL